MQASAGQHQYLLVFICIFWCLRFLFSAVQPSAAKQNEAALNYIVCPSVGASVSKQSEAALNYMLESVKKFVGSVIRAPQHIAN